jgi:RNA recognition motif-containing protein
MGLKLFVGNLSLETTEADLKEAFSSAGTCVTASIIKDRLTGASRGFGFVEMSSDDEARRAIAELNGRDLRGRAVSINEARERSESRGPRPPGGPRSFGADAPPAGQRFRKSGGSRRGLRGRKRSL